MYRYNTISKLIIIFLTAIMMIQLFPITTFAIESTDRGKITVEGVENGTTVHAYQMMTVNYDYGKDVQQPKNPMYQWADGVASWVKTNYPDYINVNNKNEVREAFSKATDSKVAEFYDKLAVAVKAGNVSLVETKVTATGEQVEISGLAMGNYFILIEGGAKVYRPLTANVVPEWNGSSWIMSTPVVSAKSSLPSITKRIDGNLEKDNVNIGDTVHYEILVTVPTYPENATAKRFVISDTLSDGLTLTSGTVKVYGVNEGASPVLLNSGYTTSTNRPDGVSGEKAVTFALDFDYSAIQSYSTVKVTYDAVLNEKAVIGNDGNLNHAILDYSNNPYDSSSWNMDEDNNTIYTYAINLEKVDEDTDEPLSGAVFTLERDGKLVSFAGTKGNYHVAKAGETAVTKVEVDSKGVLRLEGLDAATYTLTEVKAPDGYVKLQNPIELTITDEDLDGKIESNGTELENGVLPVTVKNDKGFILPVTGGMGTAIFHILGTILMCSAILLATVFLMKKKSSK